MDELIDIYNEKNEALNIIKMRSEAHKQGLWHRSAHIWIYNSKSEILLQLRSAGKIMFPGKWDVSSAGHIGAGEIPLESALRELKEEIGITAADEDLYFYKIFKQSSTYNNLLDNEFHYAYFLKFNGDIGNLILQEEEVDEIRFYHTDFLKTELNKNPGNFVPQGKNWFEIISEVEKRMIYSITQEK